MREATFFTFDGISSEEMGVQVVSLSSGLFEEQFLPDRQINETEVRGRDKPYFQGVDTKPLSFPLSIFIYDWRNRDNLRQIARWLYKDYYKPLYFDTNPQRIFYAMVEGVSTLFHNGTRDGYITLNIRCNSPYSYSPVHTIENLKSREENSINAMSLYNEGDLVISPKIWITKVNGDGSATIRNRTTGEQMTIDNLQDNEEVYIDCMNEEIVSSLEYVNVYRYENHNGNWLNFDIGDNQLEFVGDFDISMEYELIYLAD